MTERHLRRYIGKFGLYTGISILLHHEVAAQTPQFLTGNKTANIYQTGALIGLGTGNAGVSSPMTAHTGLFNALRFYYGDNILNDNNVVTPTTVTASRTLGVGGLIGAGADAYIQFRNAGNATLASGTTTYFKIGTAPTITGVSASVGALTGLAGVYNIKGWGYTGATNYVLGTGFTENNGAAAGTEVGTVTQLLIDKNGAWYAAVTPDVAYNSIRLNVGFPADLNLVGLGRDLNVKVYNAFYNNVPVGVDCGTAIFTTPAEATGINLNLGSVTQLLALDSAIISPQSAIDGNASTYARISTGVLGIASTISQTILFNGSGTATDAVKIKLALPLSAVSANVLASLTVTAYNKTTQVGSTQAISALIAADVLGLLGDNTPFEINMTPGGQFDRIKISLSNLVSLNVSILSTGVRIYEATRVNEPPVITSQPLNDTVCAGSPAQLHTTATGSSKAYEWQYYNTATSAWVAAGTSQTLSISNAAYAMNGRRYRVKVTAGYCAAAQATVTSAEAKLVVRDLPHTPPLSIAP